MAEGTIGDRDIHLFQGGSGGYGWAVNPGADVYHWAVNMDCRNGRANLVPGPVSVEDLTSTEVFGVRPGAILDWEDTDGVPFLLIPQGRAATNRVNEFKDGATLVSDSLSLNKPYLGGVVYRHDGSDADAEVAFFCDGSGNNAIRSRLKDGTYDGTSHDAKADSLWVVGGDLWRVIDGFKLEKLIISTDPTMNASWGPSQTPVGRPQYPINAVLDFGGSPLVMKGDGVFKYNAAQSVATFENQTPFVPAHPDNGKGAFADGRGRFYYPTITGRILVISFGSQSQQGPLRFHEIDRDTPFGRIQVMTADEEFVYAAIDPGFTKTQQLGLVMKSDDGGVFSTHTTNVTDQKRATSADVSALAVSGTDYIYLGADEPFWGLYFDMHTASAMSGGFGWTAEYSAGSGSWTAFTELDSTLGLRESGAIVLDPSADVYASDLWKTDTVDSQTGKYWIRLSPPDLTLVNAKIAEAYIIPYRPSYDTTNFPAIGAMLAGALPKVLVGQWRGQQIVWHDWLTLQSSKLMVMTVSRTRSSASVGEQTLYCVTPNTMLAVPVGPDADPARAAWPATNGILHAMGYSGHNFGTPANVKSVQKLVINGEFLQGDDALDVFYRYDNADRWEHDGSFSHFPIVLNNLAGAGSVLHVAVQLKDASRDAVAPYITGVIVPKGEWIDHGPLFENIGPDIASPQTI